MLKEIEIREGLTDLSPAAIATLYRRAPLLRSVKDLDELWTMYEKSSLILSAWLDGRLVGIARVLSDGILFSYLCDLAVEPDVQRVGVGKTLISAVLERCRGTDILLRDSTGSAGYYPKIGFEKVTNAWVRGG